MREQALANQRQRAAAAGAPGTASQVRPSSGTARDWQVTNAVLPQIPLMPGPVRMGLTAT